VRSSSDRPTKLMVRYYLVVLDQFHPLIPLSDTTTSASSTIQRLQQRQRAPACLQYSQALYSQSPSPTRNQTFDNVNRRTALSNGTRAQRLQHPRNAHYSRMFSTLSLLESPRQPPPYTNSVPLDYANPAAGTTQIAMIRFPAQTLPRRGSIFVNPGSHLRDLFCASASSHSRLSRWPGRERRGLVDDPCLYISSHCRQRLGCPQFRST